MRRVRAFGDDPAAAPASGGFFQDILGGITGSVKSSVASSLPTKTEAAQATGAAIVAFWIVGGITLFIVAKLLKR
jgi:hypothetical protein